MLAQRYEPARAAYAAVKGPERLRLGGKSEGAFAEWLAIRLRND